MASTIKVDKIEGSTGSTVTVPTGQTFTVTDGIAISNLPTITAVKGGTAQTTWAAGDLLYASGTDTLAKLTKPGSTMNLQMTSAGVPSWATVSAGGTLTASQDAQSGSTVDFTGIPAGTQWITVQLENVSTNGTGWIAIRLGDSGGIESTGYLGVCGGILNTAAHGQYYTTAFAIVDPTSAASGYSGIAQLRLKESSGNIWTCTSSIGATNSANDVDFSGGHKPLSGELTQIQVMTSDTFDTTTAGSVSIQYGE